MERRLAAILAADVVAYTRLMGEEEAETLAALKAHRTELVEPKAAQYNGRTIKLMGDGALMEFPSVIEAIIFAVEVQLGMRSRNVDVPEDRQILFRIGINIGDVMVEDDDIYGDGVNLAARLEGLAEPGGICVSRTVRNQVRDKIKLTFADRGEIGVKNVARPIRVFALVLDQAAEAFVTPVQRRPAAVPKRWRQIVAASLVICLLAATAVTVLRPWTPAEEPAAMERFALPLPEKPSIAVLPFENLSDDAEQDYFANGLTVDLTTALSRFSRLFVIARNSSKAYGGKPPREVAEHLGVRYVLMGSIQKSPVQLRITVQLVDAISGAHIWAEQYDRKPENIFAVQDDIVERIAGTIGSPEGRIALEERARAIRKNTPDLTAYENALRASQAFSKFTVDGFKEARRNYGKAIELDPNFHGPYIGLAWIDILEVKWGRAADPQVALERAYALTQKSMALDPDDYQNHWALGAIHMWKRQYATGIAEYERALSLNPNDANLNNEMADALTYVGRADDSIELAKNSIRLNPNYPDWYLWNLAAAYFLTRQYETALSWLSKMEDPGEAHRLLAATYAQLGRIEEAHAEAAKMLEIHPDFSISQWAATQPYQDPAYFAPYVEGLRIAGLPE